MAGAVCFGGFCSGGGGGTAGIITGAGGGGAAGGGAGAIPFPDRNNSSKSPRSKSGWLAFPGGDGGGADVGPEPAVSTESSVGTTTCPEQFGQLTTVPALRRAMPIN